MTTKQIQEAEERFWDWLKNLESYFLYKPEIRKHEVCHNANTELCEKCQEPECDLAKGWFKKRKGGAGR